VASLAGWVAPVLVIGRAITNDMEMAEVGAIPAAITGVVLVWLLRKRLSDTLTGDKTPNRSLG